MENLQDLIHELLDRLQLDSRRVALQDVPHGFGVVLQAGDQLLVRRRQAGALQLRHLGLQPLRLVLQLLHHQVPVGEAAVAGFTVGELALVSAGALVAAGTGNTVQTGALTRGPVTLGAGDPTRIAVAGWKKRRGKRRESQ